VVSAAAGSLRRRLGPTGWTVLETMLAHSTGTPATCETAATTRTLAVELGLSKDTVARALGALRRDGLIEASQDRTAAGTFTSGRYRIVVPACITFLDVDQHHTAPPVDSKIRATRPNGLQLALGFDG
jgi:DNA-binding transcriptional MocR family regulator